MGLSRWKTRTSHTGNHCKPDVAQTEQDLLGHSLNDNAAIPALCRILRTSHTLFTVSETK